MKTALTILAMAFALAGCSAPKATGLRARSARGHRRQPLQEHHTGLDPV